MTLDTLENDLSTFEPAANEILAESRNFQMPPEDARLSLIQKHRAKSDRLANYSPTAAQEIAAALEAARDAQERADNLISEQQATLDGITSAILAVGHLRKKIRALKSLLLPADAEKHLAHTALNYFVLKSESPSPENQTGFVSYVNDLAWRAVLSAHVPAYVAPLENQVATLISKIKAEAKEQKMDLKLVFQKFAAERGTAGEPILVDSELFGGLF